MTNYAETWTRHMVGTAEEADTAADALFHQDRQWRMYPVNLPYAPGKQQWAVDVLVGE